MIQFKILATAIIAGLTLLTSCNKDDNGDPTGNEETNSVRIRFTYDSQEDNTRAEAQPVTNEALEMQTGHIFFTTLDGIIDTHIGIGNSSGSIQVSVTDLLAGETVIEGIAGNVKRCYVIANDQAAGIPSAYGITGDLKGYNINESLLQLPISVNNLNNAAGDVSSVPLFGFGNLSKSEGSTPVGQKPYDALVNVPISALGSRLQIKKITGVDFKYTDGIGVEQTVSIDEFTLAGIYINNFYAMMKLYPPFSYSDLPVDNGKIASKYSKTGQTVYAAGGSGEKLADEPMISSTSKVVAPNKGAWAYNLIPTPPPGSEPTFVPHIVLKFSEVKFTNSSIGIQQTLTDRFITIKKMKFAAGGTALPGLPVLQFKYGNVYTFEDVRFDYTHLTSVPEETSVVPWVEVWMNNWFNNPVEIQ